MMVSNRVVARLSDDVVQSDDLDVLRSQLGIVKLIIGRRTEMSTPEVFANRILK